MSMDSKFYVSYEAARLLKEKGYDRETDYHIEEYIYRNMTKEESDMLDTKFPCPTKAEATDWLESKGIYIELMFNFEPSIKDHEVLWCYVIYNKIEGLGCKENYIFPTRLEAEEAAIIKALELL